MAVSVVSFSFSMAAQPEHWSPLCWVLAFLTTSRLSHSNSTRLSTGSSNSTQLSTVQFVGLILSSNSHAVIWTRLRNFFRCLAIGMCHFRFPWNGLCDRHRAEITVMQFRGHALPVRQSIMGFCFTSSHFISQFPPTRFPLTTAIRMCHFLLVHHLEWHFWPGQKFKT